MNFTKIFYLCVVLLLIAIYSISFMAIIHEDQALLHLGNTDIHIGKCFIKETTGLNCPACGLTRSFISLSDGNFNNALAYNPGGIIVYIVGILLTFNAIWFLITNTFIKGLKSIICIIGILACMVLVINWIISLLSHLVVHSL